MARSFTIVNFSAMAFRTIRTPGNPASAYFHRDGHQRVEQEKAGDNAAEVPILSNHGVCVGETRLHGTTRLVGLCNLIFSSIAACSSCA